MEEKTARTSTPGKHVWCEAPNVKGNTDLVEWYSNEGPPVLPNLWYWCFVQPQRNVSSQVHQFLDIGKPHVITLEGGGVRSEMTVYCRSHLIHTTDLVGDNHHSIHILPHLLHQFCLLSQSTFKCCCVYCYTQVLNSQWWQYTNLQPLLVPSQQLSELPVVQLPPSHHCSTIE